MLKASLVDWVECKWVEGHKGSYILPSICNIQDFGNFIQLKGTKSKKKLGKCYYINVGSKHWILQIFRNGFIFYGLLYSKLCEWEKGNFEENLFILCAIISNFSGLYLVCFRQKRV